MLDVIENGGSGTMRIYGAGGSTADAYGQLIVASGDTTNSKVQSGFVRVYNTHANNTDGSNMVIQSGGNMVIGGGAINGSYWLVYEEFKDEWRRRGLDFSKCKSKQEVLDMIGVEEDKPTIETNYQEEMMYALQDIAINLMPQLIGGIRDV